MRKSGAQLDSEIAAKLKSTDVGIKKLWAWLPKLNETIVDVNEGRRSYRSGDPLRVSRLDSPRGAYFIIDGHHRAVEAILAGRSTVAVEIDPHVPRIEHAGNAYQSYIENKVNAFDFLKRR